MAASRRKPQLTNAAWPATREVQAVNERCEMAPTVVPVEPPLTLYPTAG